MTKEVLNDKGWDNFAQAVAEQSTSEKTDNPAVDPISITRDRMKQLLDNVTLSTLTELTVLRDEIDNLMRTIRFRNDHLLNQVEAHVEFSCQAIETKKIVSDGLASIKEKFANGKAVPLGITLKAET